MMSFSRPEEVPEIPIAGRQIGDTSLMTPDGIVHLPDCMSFKAHKQSDCSCGAKFVKKSEFTAGDKQ